ncbi:PfkB family carbohydrate kinase [Draconibacterium halophilum]|uniref:Sugar kinase n=1 Tax=Draconibacterium halophilum TaxID=2706887 RepID=A0A6C0REE6_9BACT|nr:PfkB family carbohydrate kinase [Draconibacterium halophilum]QIA08252.1 sugar kinase [Draconibacterium halophilum]
MKHKALFVGLTTIDIQYFIDQIPVANTKVKTDIPDILVGGPATNAAVAFAYLNKTATLASPAGLNAFSSFIDQDLNSVGVDHFDLAYGQEFETILATVLTSKNGDRTIVTHNPTELESTILPQKLIDLVEPQILLVDGFYPEFSLECSKICKMQGIPVVSDCGSWKPQFDEQLNYIDIAICSTDFMPPQCHSQNELFDFMRAKNVKSVAISNGSHKIEYLSNEKKGSVTVPQVEVKDTLGAGDFLHGAFCYYFLECNDFAEAIKQASSLASFTCSIKGTRKWLNFNHNT